MRSLPSPCEKCARIPVRFEKFRVRRQRFRQAEVVEHRRVQELTDRGRPAASFQLRRALPRARRARGCVPGVRSATPTAILIAVSAWPTSSCSSRARLRRSCSCASTRRPTGARDRDGCPSPRALAVDLGLESGDVPRREPRGSETEQQGAADNPDKPRLRVGVERATSALCCRSAACCSAFRLSSSVRTSLRIGRTFRRSIVAARVVLVGRSSAKTNCSEVQNSGSFACSLAHSSRSPPTAPAGRIPRRGVQLLREGRAVARGMSRASSSASMSASRTLIDLRGRCGESATRRRPRERRRRARLSPAARRRLLRISP